MPESDQIRLERFRRVLLAACQTDHYRTWLQRERIAAFTSIPEALRSLPPLSLQEFQRHPERFRNANAPPPQLPSLHFPLDRLPRTAVLAEGFRTARNVRVFSNGLGRRFDRFGAAVLAGPLDRLRGLAEAIRQGRLRRPDRAVLALTRIGRARLSDEDREALWSSYQVPVFEEVLDLAGEPAACECEAHNALHVREHAAYFESAAGELLFTSLADLCHPLLRLATGWPGLVVTGYCDCGVAGERLVGPNPPAC